MHLEGNPMLTQQVAWHELGSLIVWLSSATLLLARQISKLLAWRKCSLHWGPKIAAVAWSWITSAIGRNLRLIVALWKPFFFWANVPQERKTFTSGTRNKLGKFHQGSILLESL